jgi:VWFA-related protein
MVKRSLPAVLALLCAGALAQSGQPQPQPQLQPVPRAKDQTPPKAPDKNQEKPFKIITSVSEVPLPVTFLDGTGEFVTDIEKPEITLLDNRNVQKINTFEIAYRPISMVILIDTSTRVDGVVANLRTSGILFTQLVMGETGEAAVVTYDQTIEVRQPFTQDGDLIEKAFKKLESQAGQSRLTDAVFRALGMLGNRTQDRRKVIVILGEGRDIGSESRKNQALREAQVDNVSIYAVEMSAFRAMAKKPLPQTMDDPMPPGSKPLPPGVPLGSQGGVNGFDLMPAMVEGVRAVKGLLWDHPMKAYSTGTGSDHINATNSKSVEQAVQRIGRELHSQYYLSYIPNNTRGEEFHTIEVKVSRPGIKARTRPGYLYVPPAGDVTEPEKLPKQ